MTVATEMKRREFLKAGAALGGGLLISLYVPDFARRSAAASSDKSVALNAFVRIAPDESVTVISNHSEMGQGIYTSLPMLINEELEADWSKIRVESAPVEAVYNHTAFGIMMTGGSTTTASEYDRFRKMGAMARIMLIAAAAQSWNVDPQSCHAEKGYVIHAPSGRRASYGSLAEAAAKIEPPKDVPLKDPKDFTIIGKPVRRLDTPSKTNGTAQFGLDVYIPGMLTAVVQRAPVFGGKLSVSMQPKRKLFPASSMSCKSLRALPSSPKVSGPRSWVAKNSKSNGTKVPAPLSRLYPCANNSPACRTLPATSQGKLATPPRLSPAPRKRSPPNTKSRTLPTR